MNVASPLRAVLSFLLVLILTASAAGPMKAQGRQTPPPEYREIAAAQRIKDPSLRLKEFERIKAAYPGSVYGQALDEGILEAKVTMSTTLEAVVDLQKAFLDGLGPGPDRLVGPVAMTVLLLNHPRLASFDRARVLDIALTYREMVRRAAEDPSSYEGVPAEDRDPFKASVFNALELLAARAYANAGDAAKAMASIESYRKSGGTTGGNYFYVLAGVLETMGKLPEAVDAYLSAAAEKFGDAADKARALYTRVHGSAAGFDAALGAKLRALPFRPAPFEAPREWSGRTVLAELFTGSECPPCVGADIAFDGLIETIPAKYLAVLVYHLPIPRPDPMMNPATGLRADAYGVNSTPTVVIDGLKRSSGGGGRGAAEAKFAEYRSAIEPRLAAAPAVSLKARASLEGDTVRVTYDFDRTVPGAEYILVLVQAEQEHPGGNGVVFHKMVVRDLQALDPAAKRTAAFELAASERATDDYLTAFERSGEHAPGFKWAVRRNAVSRQGLRVVLFVQDKASNEVLNAVIADVQ